MKTGYVYILTNAGRSVLYTGVTSALKGRVWQHKNGQGGKFTSTYKVNQLVYYEVHDSMYEAIRREKKLKGSSRLRKAALVTNMNPHWLDLYDDL